MTAGVTYSSPQALYVGEQIERLIEEQGYSSQSELARALGMECSVVFLWIRNKRPVPKHRIWELAEIFDVPVQTLLDGKPIPAEFTLPQRAEAPTSQAPRKRRRRCRVEGCTQEAIYRAQKCMGHEQQRFMPLMANFTSTPPRPPEPKLPLVTRMYRKACWSCGTEEFFRLNAKQARAAVLSGRMRCVACLSAGVELSEADLGGYSGKGKYGRGEAA